MPQCFQTPEHVSSVFAPSRELKADKDGVITLPDGAPDCDREALLRVGCVRIADQTAPQKPVKSDSSASAAKPAKG